MTDNNTDPATVTEDQKDLILEIEDDMIVKFCELNGGMEFAMPIIRNQYEKLNIDFKNPSKEQLYNIADRLVEVTEEIKGEIVAKEERRIFKELLAKLGKKPGIQGSGNQNVG